MATPEEIAAQRRAALEAAARQPVYGPRNPQQPIASPGYSDDLNTRRVQAYRDAQQQRAAVAGEPLVSPGYTHGLAGMQAAQDARMQRDAVAALPPPRVAGRDPDVPYAPVDMASLPQTPASAALTSAGNQPVYGPRNPPGPPSLARPPVPAGRNPDVPYAPGQEPVRPPVPAGRNPDVPYAPAPTPVTPTAPTVQQQAQPGVAADFQRGLVGTAKAGVGALAYPAALALDASRRGVTSLVGGDVNTLPGGADYLTRQAEGAMAGGYEDAAGAAASLRGRTASQGRELLGVQQAADTPAAVTPAIAGTPSAAQTQAPAVTNEQVLAQDRANTAAFVASQPGAPTTTLSPDLLAETNQRIASAIEGSRGPTYANKRGEYSMTGTSPDVVADARRRADTGSGGINFGFAPGEATARMQGYAAQDVQRQAAFQAKRQRLDAAVEGIGLRNTIEQATNPQVRRAAQTRLAALETSGNLATQQAGETSRAGISAGADIERARIAGQYGLLGAQTQGEYGLEGQDIAGKYGLLAADIKAQADQRVASASVDPKKQQEAMLLAARNQQLLDAIARDDQEAIRFYTSGKYAPVAQGDRSPISGITYDQPTVAAMQESERLSAQQRLQAQKTQ